MAGEVIDLSGETDSAKVAKISGTRLLRLTRCHPVILRPAADSCTILVRLSALYLLQDLTPLPEHVAVDSLVGTYKHL